MFCAGCGTERAAAAPFCSTCGLPFPDTQPSYAVSSSGAAVAPALAAQTPPSYLWGYIHGWSLLAGCPLLFLLFLVVFFAPSSDRDTKLGAVMLMAGLAFGTLVGFTIIRKKFLGMILVFVCTGLHLPLAGLFVLAMFAPQHPPAAGALVVASLVGFACWAACSAYYYKRRQFLT